VKLSLISTRMVGGRLLWPPGYFANLSLLRKRRIRVEADRICTGDGSSRFTVTTYRAREEKTRHI